MKSNKQKAQAVAVAKEEESVGVMRTVEQMHEESDKRVGQVFQTMLIFTALMVLGPISTYFLSKAYIFERYFTISKESSYIYSAISAVVVVHIILGAFIYAAWKDANAAAIIKKKE